MTGVVGSGVIVGEGISVGEGSGICVMDGLRVGEIVFVGSGVSVDTFFDGTIVLVGVGETGALYTVGVGMEMDVSFRICFSDWVICLTKSVGEGCSAIVGASSFMVIDCALAAV